MERKLPRRLMTLPSETSTSLELQQIIFPNSYHIQFTFQSDSKQTELPAMDHTRQNFALRYISIIFTELVTDAVSYGLQERTDRPDTPAKSNATREPGIAVSRRLIDPPKQPNPPDIPVTDTARTAFCLSVFFNLFCSWFCLPPSIHNGHHTRRKAS